jgi:hypothetical protein
MLNVLLVPLDGSAQSVHVVNLASLSQLSRWANPSTCGEVIEQSRCAVLIETWDKD